MPQCRQQRRAIPRLRPTARAPQLLPITAHSLALWGWHWPWSTLCCQSAAPCAGGAEIIARGRGYSLTPSTACSEDIPALVSLINNLQQHCQCWPVPHTAPGPHSAVPTTVLCPPGAPAVPRGCSPCAPQQDERRSTPTRTDATTDLLPAAPPHHPPAARPTARPHTAPHTQSGTPQRGPSGLHQCPLRPRAWPQPCASVLSTHCGQIPSHLAPRATMRHELRAAPLQDRTASWQPAPATKAWPSPLPRCGGDVGGSGVSPARLPPMALALLSLALGPPGMLSKAPYPAHRHREHTACPAASAAGTWGSGMFRGDPQPPLSHASWLQHCSLIFSLNTQGQVRREHPGGCRPCAPTLRAPYLLLLASPSHRRR